MAAPAMKFGERMAWRTTWRMTWRATWIVRWLAITVVLTALCWGALSSYAALDRPITTVKIEGMTNAAQRAEVQSIVDAHLGRGVLSTDVHAIGEGLRRLEWTRQVSVRRIWPDRIVVELSRATPIARWNRDRLLGEDGRTYPLDAQHVELAARSGGEMPALFGPEAESREVLERYQVLRDTAAVAGLAVTSAGVDAQGEWSMVLDNRIPVQLGSTDMLVRARRVIDLYTRHLAAVGDTVASVDSRYSNGVAVAWRPKPQALQPGETPVAQPLVQPAANLVATVLAVTQPN